MNRNAEQNENEANQKFEKSLRRLEEIVAAMEQGELSLEKTLQYYEEGMKLAKFCSDKLGDAEKRIEALSGRDEEGKPEWSPLEQPE